MLTDTISQNTLRAVRFERPDYIPVFFWINPACWNHYDPEFLRDLIAEHPILFDHLDPQNNQPPKLAPWERAGKPYTDAWGCIWQTTDDGITGVVTEHPLSNWNALQSFTPPDPAATNGMKKIDWPKIKQRAAAAKAEQKHYLGSLEHGHTFQRLTYLRGYENLLFDMTDENAELPRLIEIVESFNLALVRRYLDAGTEMICYPEDLGMQQGPMLSPDHFRKYIKPIYKNLTAPARQAGCIVHMHSDGDIRDLAEDIIAAGADVLNLQDLVNEIDWIAENLKGRICIDLDIDRQQITRFGAPAQIDSLIREEVEKLATHQGGLMLIYGLYPGIPRENIKALTNAMQKYATHHT